jgi:hypothetical protein
MAGSYCRITIYDDEQWIRVDCAVNDDFLRKLKDHIPHYNRIWDQASFVWSIHPEYKPWLIEETQQIFNNVIVIDDGQARLVKG